MLLGHVILCAQHERMVSDGMLRESSIYDYVLANNRLRHRHDMLAAVRTYNALRVLLQRKVADQTKRSMARRVGSIISRLVRWG